MEIDKDRALEMLAEIKGEFQSMSNALGKQVDWTTMHLLYIDMVQLFIDPDCDLNAIQTLVNKRHMQRSMKFSKKG